MPQQDKFKREIDRIGLVLSRLLGLLLNKPRDTDAQVNDVIHQANEELQIDIPALLAMPGVEVLQFLIDEKRFSNEHLRMFANMLYDMAAKTGDDDRRKIFHSKALCIYEYIQANGNGTLYLDVLYRINELKA